MAKIKLSSIGITNISGKAGGSIYSKNKGGTYFKNFTVPGNPNTSAQQGVRSIFGSISAGWTALSDAAKQSWISNAPNSPYTDEFGDTRIYSGFNLYMKRNLNLLNSGQAPESNWGTSAFEAIISSVGAYDIGAGDDFSVLNTFFDNQGVDGAVVLEATPPKQSAIGNVDNEYRKIATAAFTSPASNATVGSRAAYEAVFGVPAEGDIIRFRVKVVNEVGEVKTWFYQSLTVVST